MVGRRLQHAANLQVSLSCSVLCQIVSLHYISRSSLRRLTGLPCRMSPSCGTWGSSVECLWRCPLSSVLVRDVEHTSFHFGLCSRKFVLCLFGQCPGLCTISRSWRRAGVAHLPFQGCFWRDPGVCPDRLSIVWVVSVVVWCPCKWWVVVTRGGHRSSLRRLMCLASHLLCIISRQARRFGLGV